MDWTRELKKSQKREFRRIVALAYERELNAALSALDEQFGRWRAGELGPHELDKVIHKFHQETSRTLWSRYTGPIREVAAIAAIARGIVAQHEVAADLMEILRPKLVAFE